jgi:sorbitol-6-phosphate 2-dehydrogenase
MDPKEKSILELVPAIRMIMSEQSLKSGSFVMLDQLKESDPEQISEGLGRTISVFRGEPEEILNQIKSSSEDIGEYIFIEELGLLGLSSDRSMVEQKLATVRKESRGADLPKPVASPQFRKPLYNRVVAITGGAMGFGEGIARHLFGEGANVVIMDINKTAGERLAAELNEHHSPNRAWFVESNVGSLESMEGAIFETVLKFSGLDVLISNAGVLKAGSIEEMDEKGFDQVSLVNYKGYFNCVKAVIPVMKVQNQFSDTNFGDIIQINSKSGLEGSKKNFAYAGSKFGGIGLTQSFAKELIGDRIKVNSICPGNYFEGPLWSHPENGLFVQYLNTGKVPGAKTIADVKRHYEALVPAGRGCRVEDVVKAIKYVIEQEYETGQAIPVTGGQVMLS